MKLSINVIWFVVQKKEKLTPTTAANTDLNATSFASHQKNSQFAGLREAHTHLHLIKIDHCWLQISFSYAH